MQRSVVSIIIPAYNEEDTIGAVIGDTIATMDSLGLPYEVIVIDDGSTDKTRQIATTYKATVLFNEKNRGKGHAVRKGLQHAQGDIIVTIDADGAHSPKEIPYLIDPLFKGLDIVAGSRFLGPGRESTAKLNRFGSMLFNTTIMVLARKPVTDSQTGFRAFKREVRDGLSLESLGFEIETEITVKGLRNGFTFQELPISCARRKYNISKVKVLSDGARILRTILKAKFASNGNGHKH